MFLDLGLIQHTWLQGYSIKRGKLWKLHTAEEREKIEQLFPESSIREKEWHIKYILQCVQLWKISFSGYFLNCEWWLNMWSHGMTYRRRRSLVQDNETNFRLWKFLEVRKVAFYKPKSSIIGPCRRNLSFLILLHKEKKLIFLLLLFFANILYLNQIYIMIIFISELPEIEG